MLIKIDNWLDSILTDSEEYIGKTPCIQIGEDRYIEVDELIGTIENLCDEINRQVEKVEQLDREIQNDYIRRKLNRTEYGE